MFKQKLKSLFNKSRNTSHGNCYDPKNKKFWCKECVPHTIVKGWTSGSNVIDNFIKDTIYYAKEDNDYCPLFLEWVPFDKFTDIKQIGEGGFAKVYSATWIDGKAKYTSRYQYDDNNYIWKRSDHKPMKIALKRLNGSQNISAEYLNEFKIHLDLSRSKEVSVLKLYGITKDPETNEFMMITEFADKGNLRYIISSDFNNILWKDKIYLLFKLSFNLKNLHKLGYSHKNFHCGNVLQNNNNWSFMSDFGLLGPSNEQITNDKVYYGVLPYIAPEVLNGEQYTLTSDIYSFGIIMTELSSGKPPFHKRKHDAGLALDICNGLRPEFGNGTPEIYKKLAYRCMDANPDQRPTANELYFMLYFWDDVLRYGLLKEEKFGYKGGEIKVIFERANKEIPNISTLYEKNPDAIYTSRAFKFSNLSKPINSSIITSYLNDNNYENNNEKRNNMWHGKCENCSKNLNNKCLSCRFKQDFNEWTSGNKNIDELIQNTQVIARDFYDGILEWIPYDRFTNIKYFAKGGFAKVYSAIWIDGYIVDYLGKPDDFERKGPLEVALKVLNDSSKKISESFLNEVKSLNKFPNINLGVVEFYGITQEPTTHNYALVFKLEDGSLHSYLHDQNKNNPLTLERKLDIIKCICSGLRSIHSYGLIHKDLHMGNILHSFLNGQSYTCISDFGFCRPANENSSKLKLYGVMPYMAPEILRHELYTKESDIYSLGIIINEIISETLPFNEESHDQYLVLDICCGKRPTINEETSKFLKELIKKCWNANPKDRPSIDEIDRLVDNFIRDGDFNKYQIKFKTHLKANKSMNTSRLLNLSDHLPEPVNCENQEEFVSSRIIAQVKTGETNVLRSDECLDCEIEFH